MRANRILLSSVLIIVALMVQAAVLSRLRLPGAVPDLILLVVVALAITYGPVGGCLVGFTAGLLNDLAPPADHAVGRYALVLCLIGYLAGLAKPETGHVRSAGTPMFVVASAAVGGTLLTAVVGALVGDTAARHVGIAGLAFSALLYDLLLAPFTVPWIMALARRTDNSPVIATGLGTPSGSAAPGTSTGWLSSAGGRGIGRFGLTGTTGSTGRVRGGFLRGEFLRTGRSIRTVRQSIVRQRIARQRIAKQRSGAGRPSGRSGLGRLGKRP